jgi:hypothetical protein
MTYLMFDLVCFLTVLADLHPSFTVTRKLVASICAVRGYGSIFQPENILEQESPPMTAELREPSPLYKFSNLRPQTAAMLINRPTQHHKHLVCSRTNLGRTLNTSVACLQ